jgi:hypothetical protein
MLMPHLRYYQECAIYLLLEALNESDVNAVGDAVTNFGSDKTTASGR